MYVVFIQENANDVLKNTLYQITSTDNCGMKDGNGQLNESEKDSGQNYHTVYINYDDLQTIGGNVLPQVRLQVSRI